ncbi:LysM peptidoglycan-binding domain-containing protein [Demequina sp. SO4-13]|uniref:LysM peptidoglycan-binding domain-containing protein n=1 Tax=Demequina sp. SO4-13 TaxID=3401027 RepID=UPI003AF412F7
MTAYAISAPATTGVSVRRVVSVRPLPTAAGRARRTVLAAVLVLAVAALVALLAPRAFAGDEVSEMTASGNVAFDTYTVAQGDSLWSIATTMTGPGEDVRDTVAELQTLNAMGDSSLRAGEQIYIPALES